MGLRGQRVASPLPAMGNLYPPQPSFHSFRPYYLISNSIILPSSVSVPLNENRKATKSLLQPRLRVPASHRFKHQGSEDSSIFWSTWTSRRERLEHRLPSSHRHAPWLAGWHDLGHQDFTRINFFYFLLNPQGLEKSWMVWSPDFSLCLQTIPT